MPLKEKTAHNSGADVTQLVAQWIVTRFVRPRPRARVRTEYLDAQGKWTTDPRKRALFATAKDASAGAMGSFGANVRKENRSELMQRVADAEIARAETTAAKAERRRAIEL